MSDTSGIGMPAQKKSKMSATDEGHTTSDKQSTLPFAKKATVINVDNDNADQHSAAPKPKKAAKKAAKKAEHEYEEGVHQIKGIKPDETAV